MPPRKRASTTLDGDARESSEAPRPPTSASAAADALSLAEEAEAEALAAEADAAAARARARAVRLRRLATTAPASETSESTDAPETDPEANAPYVAVLSASEQEPTTDDDSGAAVSTAGASTAGDGRVDHDDARRAPGRRRVRFGPPRTRLVWVAAIVVVLCSLGFLAASVAMVVHHRQVVAEQQRSAEFAAAARQGVVTLMSLNFNSAQDDVKRIIDNTTGDFKKDFEGQADEFAKVAQSSKVVTEATVNSTAVQTMSNDTATVLVAVTTQVSNSASKEPQPRSWRLRVDMARDGGQLKLAKVEFVP